MKILKITESQYKRLVRVKNLNEQITYPSMDIETQERHDITPDLKDYLGWLNDTLGYLHNLPLYINKIDSGVVYIDWTKYSEEEKNLIKKYNKEWVDHTKDPKDGVSGNGYYSSGLDWDFEDEPEYVYNPEDWPDETKDDVVIEPEKDKEDVQIKPKQDGKYNTSSLLSYYKKPKKDLERGIINPDLINDIIKALESINMSATITTGKSGHNKETIYGTTSNHSVGDAVDIAVIGGVSDNGKHTIKNKGVCEKCNKQFKINGDKLVDALKKLGYSYGESKSRDKAYLWWTDTGGNHYNHIHVSNRRDK